MRRAVMRGWRAAHRSALAQRGSHHVRTSRKNRDVFDPTIYAPHARTAMRAPTVQCAGAVTLVSSLWVGLGSAAFAGGMPWPALRQQLEPRVPSTIRS
jgi:hypothetical protein